MLRTGFGGPLCAKKSRATFWPQSAPAVVYYNSETKIYVTRGNNTNEDDVVDPDDLRSVSENVLVHFQERSHRLRPDNNTESESKFSWLKLLAQMLHE